MTEISVNRTAFQSEDRSWHLSELGTGPGENPSVTLDVSAFTKATHYPNGYFPSGLAVGKITATSDANKTVVGPYDDTAVDGRQTCIGLLGFSVKVPDMADTTKDVGGATVVIGMVKLSRLPVALDAAGQADLKLIHFTA